MATAEQVKALIESHTEGDDPRFLAIAMQVAALEARQGHLRLAGELRELIDRAKDDRVKRPVPLAQPRGELGGLIVASYPKTRLNELVVPLELRHRLDRLLKEQRQSERLRSFGLSPRHRVLLVGPPGTGKTMCATVIAGELHLPLFKVVFESLVTKFLGETAAKLKLVFDAIQTTRGVYFFDEFDAIGGQRTAKNDVGEIRRVVNSFLQLLEQDDSNSIVLAATNHPQMLDRALFRRFDDIIKFTLPSLAQGEATMRNRLTPFDISTLKWSRVRTAIRGLSHAHLVRACDDAAKQAILTGERQISTEGLLHALREQREFSQLK
ncbi:ATP-binding protein [Myxococcus sp. AM001]|nr:ATP-binding protein [Myxococcus sp. AM001]